jgi:hypothetical protein
MRHIGVTLAGNWIALFVFIEIGDAFFGEERIEVWRFTRFDGWVERLNDLFAYDAI